MPADRPTLTLIDGSSYVYRAYHAIPHLSSSRGIPTNAVLGFTTMVLKALRERDPTHVAMVFDSRGRTFRDEIDPTYKANRPPAPEDLAAQFPLVRQVTAALNLAVLEESGVEADDVIATLSGQAVAAGFRVVVVTGDKDFMQLVTPEIELFDPMSEKHTGVKEVIARLGIRPDQVVDYMSLIGDSIDNVPGVPGVGPKTASKLLADFGTLDSLLEGTDRIEKPKLRELIRSHREEILRARRLVQLRHDVPLPLGPKQLARRDIDAEACRKLFSELEFTRLLRDLPAPPPAALTAAATHTEVIRESGALAELARQLAAAPRFGVQVLAEPQRPPVGIAFSVAAGRASYVPISHLYLGAQQLPKSEIYEGLRAALESDTPKVGHDLKADWRALERVGLRLRGLKADPELSSFLLNAGRREHALADLSRERLHTELPFDVRLAKPARPLEEADIDASAAFAGASAEAALRLEDLFRGEIDQAGLGPVLDEMEIPLEPILAEMESAGILLDVARLRSQGAAMELELAKGLERIHALAGHAFNAASNPQLAEVLFVELRLPVIRRTKTGPSVDQEVLEKLAEQHPLPQAILEHRSLSKLKSTYLDTLPMMVDPAGRIHTTFHQTGAATGRLSSSDPNLQNIPVRSEIGRRIREAFVAQDGWVLVSADYSQIELRVLAHVSEDPALLGSFERGEDVHSRTAAEVFGVKLEAVTDAQRRSAKAINFGIAYGQTSFGLSHRLDISGADAKGIIDRYFERYGGVRTWLDATIEQVKRTGEVSTLFGRRRFVPEIHSRNFAIRAGAERIAVNTPIQGTAADIVKRAMIGVHRRLAQEKLRSRMLLQVHDELLFEVPEAEVDALRLIAVEEMEGAAQLKARLAVDVGQGRSWAEAH